MGEKTHNHELVQAALNSQIKSHANVANAYATEMAWGERALSG